MEKTSKTTAAVLIIGNEILSGRTVDKNLAFLGEQLNLKGISICEARIIQDDKDMIIDSVNTLRQKYTFVFTTGGIGPTHDDITSENVARAFNVPLEDNSEARQLLEAYYGDTLNDARLRMARIPQGATLIDNPVSAAPGFYLENVYVMAGIPKIMQAMYYTIAPHLTGGDVTHTVSIDCHYGEGDIAEGLQNIQQDYPQIEIGSYPATRPGDISVNIVLRHSDRDILAAAAEDIKIFLETLSEKQTPANGW